MSLAAVAVRNQRKKQKVQAALFLAQHPVLPVLPATELPGGAALLLLELGRVNPGGFKVGFRLYRWRGGKFGGK